MAFNKWLINELMIYNTSGIESDFPIDYQKLLCVIEGAVYPDYNFLIQIIEFLGLDTQSIIEMVNAVSEDLNKTIDEVYGNLLYEIESIKENDICLKRNME